MTKLKKIRVIVSLLFFFAISLIFLDYINVIPLNFYEYVLWLQFIPSLTKFVNSFAISAFGFFIVLLSVLLFGRVYCSSICPLGTFQDFISKISQKIFGANYFSWSKELKWVRYSILIFSILSIPLIGMFIIGLLDPFSNFGRILTNLFYPVIILLNNQLSSIFESMGLYLIYPIDIRAISLVGLLISIIILSVLIVMSSKRGRLFCNTICPLGTFLGFISKVSLFKIKIKEEDCEACGVCETVCKAECINSESKEINFERCVVCFNCFRECPTMAINFYKHNSFIFKNTVQFKADRRIFLSKLYYIVVGLGSFSFAQLKIIPEKESTVPIKRNVPVSPPGSNNIDHFISTCTACHLCVAVCPTKVLQPSVLQYGLEGLLQPRMDYLTNYCNYECVECMKVCPTDALKELVIEDKKLTQLGKSKFIKENCIVETEKKECGACSERCPTKAVRMIPYENNLHIPEIKNEYCIGCGACEFACPTKPYKAIYVEGNPKHLRADKPPDEILEQKIDYQEEFPF